MGSRRKKRRTHVAPSAEAIAAVPKSFVIRAGGSQAHSASLSHLVRDVRRVMEPNTASNIKERKGNKLKDFVHVAGMLGVSHLVMFSTSESNSGAKLGLRMGRMPRGPTMYFNVKEYVLTKDVQGAQMRPKSPGSDFKTSPLVVLNNFNDPAKHVKLMATMFQNMFPPINVQTMKLNDARRIVLFNLDSEKGVIEMRHYSIGVKPIGLSKSVKNLVQTNIPDLNKFEDVSDYVLRSAFASESDVEDGPESTVTLAQKYVGRGNNSQTAAQRAVKLVELGPRLQLKLVKITEGLCSGEVLHHSYVQKSAEQIAEQKQKLALKEKEREKRRAEQDANVAKKKGLKEGDTSAAKKRVRIEGDDEEEDDQDDESDGDGDDEAEDEDQEYEFGDEEAEQEDSDGGEGEEEGEEEEEEEA
ncbi:hypothetical protein HDU77_010403 [Chytriomyces hyalinus]|nr:hypothetical protein HDU77_010403 [Chytriomyces hyalinus]